MEHMVGDEPEVPMVEEAVEQQPDPTRHLVYDHKILTCFVAYGLYFMASIAVIVPLSLVGLDQRTMQPVVSIVAGLIVLLIYELRFRGSFDGMLKWSREGLLLAVPLLIFSASNFVDLANALIEGEALNPIPQCLLMALAPGVAEEVVFRAVPAANWMRVRRERRDAVMGVLFTALVFGLVHGSNALLGAPMSTTIFQVCYAMCFGVACGAVLMRSGSIIPTMIAHTFIDFTAFLTLDLSHSGVMMDELVFDLSFYVTVVSSIAVLLWGLYLIRPAKLDDIVELWNKKWGSA